MDSLAVSQIESDLWPPHSWPLRWPTAIVCFWPSAAQLSRHRRCASQPCFHRVKWKVHNPLLIAVPWAVEQPQLNTGQSWLPANLSNKPTSSLFPPKNVIRFFSPPSVPFTLTPAAGHPDLFYLHWLSSKRLTLTTRVYTFHSSPLVGTEKVSHFVFLVSYQISWCIYTRFPVGLQEYKRHVFPEFKQSPPHRVTHAWWHADIL